MEAIDILEGAFDLIKDPTVWIKHAYARIDRCA